VAAGVVEGPDPTVAVAQNDERVLPDRKRDPVARPPDLAFVAGEQPFRAEHRLHLGREDIAVEVKGLRQAEAGAALFERDCRRWWDIGSSAGGRRETLIAGLPPQAKNSDIRPGICDATPVFACMIAP